MGSTWIALIKSGSWGLWRNSRNSGQRFRKTRRFSSCSGAVANARTAGAMNGSAILSLRPILPLAYSSGSGTLKRYGAAHRNGSGPRGRGQYIARRRIRKWPQSYPFDPFPFMDSLTCKMRQGAARAQVGQVRLRFSLAAAGPTQPVGTQWRRFEPIRVAPVAVRPIHRYAIRTDGDHMQRLGSNDQNARCGALGCPGRALGERPFGWPSLAR